MLKTWKYFLFRVSGDNINIELCILHGGRPPEERDGAGESRDAVAEGCRECHHRDKVEAPKPKRRLLDICNSAQAERVFLWMGWPLNKRRLSMSGEIESMQLFLKDDLDL